MKLKFFLLLLGILFISARAAFAQTQPAIERLAQIAAVVSKGDPASAQEFVRQSYAPGFLEIAPLDYHASWLLSLRYQGRFEPSDPVATSATQAAAAVRNPLTEEIDSIFVRVDSSAPYRIRGISYRAGAGGELAPTIARTDDERARELARYVRKLADHDRFSGVVLFAHKGRPLHYQAYGLANKDFDVPNRKDTKFNLGSANKNFTAIVIEQLVEEGKLSWDDPLSKFIPDFPDSASAKKVQIKHLLSHTAGLGSYFSLRFTESSRAMWRTVDDFMKLARPDSLRFEPGSAFSYSNTGYLVLGKVIEIVEGRSYYDVVRDRIAEPLGLSATDAYELDRVNPNLAVGYIRSEGPDSVTYRNNIFEHVIRGGPAGGGYSNAPDMLKYAEALRTGKLIKPGTLAPMRTPKPELNAPRYGYGFALFDRPDIWGHGGDFPGIDFDLNQYGDSGYTLIVLANYDGVNRPILNKVRRMLQSAGVLATQ